MRETVAGLSGRIRAHPISFPRVLEPTIAWFSPPKRAGSRENRHGLRVRRGLAQFGRPKTSTSIRASPLASSAATASQMLAHARRPKDAENRTDLWFSQQAESRVIVPFCGAPHAAAEHRDREVPAVLHHGFFAPTFLYASRDPTRTQ